MLRVHGRSSMRAGGGMLPLSSPPTNSTTPFVLSTTKFFKQHIFSASPQVMIPQIQLPLPCVTKRNLSLSMLLSFSSIGIATPSQASVDELKRYTDDKEGFTLLIPSSWVKVDKAGATVLFEEMNNKINNVGVVVTPVRLMSLGDFGSPQFVADKLIQAEKRKESTKDAEVIGVTERPGHGGLQVYEFEYMLDSTRGGMKRIFSAAFVASKKLYLLNITYSDKPENPLDKNTTMMLEQVLHSFDTASSV